jgi:probable HAF family extracellular repeat protein
MMIFGFLGFASSACWAEALYSVTNLGSVNPSADYLSGKSQLDPSGNYLSALSSADQATFKAGSFDVYAHPATAGPLPDSYDGDVAHSAFMSRDMLRLSSPDLVTSNNRGVDAGSSFLAYQNLDDYTIRQLVTFTPSPHSFPPPGGDWYPNQTIHSPGYLGNIRTYTDNNPYGIFNGTVAGINDHAIIAFTQTSWVGVQVPYLQGVNGSGQGTLKLGNLGGANAVANALNNSNQVVGWSQIASGAQHAFLYTNGTMQDLNLLIPPVSGITLTSAVGIDSSGRIVAYGTNASGQTEEFLLTPLEAPVPEPSALAVFGLVIFALAARQVRWRFPKSPAPFQGADE